MSVKGEIDIKVKTKVSRLRVCLKTRVLSIVESISIDLLKITGFYRWNLHYSSILPKTMTKPENSDRKFRKES